MTKDGGMRTRGCLDGDSYYIAAPDGIRKLDLESGTMELVKTMDLLRCGRAELKRTALPGGPESVSYTHLTGNILCILCNSVNEFCAKSPYTVKQFQRCVMSDCGHAFRRNVL